MKNIKGNRSKRKYVNTSNKYVSWAAVDKLKFEEKVKLLKAYRYFVILSFYELDDVLPFPTSVKYLIKSYYRPMQPYVSELQVWFGEDSCNRRYHDLSPQGSLLVDFMELN